MKYFGANRSWIFFSITLCLLLLALLRAPSIVPSQNLPEVHELRQLPALLGLSLLRMLVAFILSVIFGLVAGTLAATDEKRARVLLPTLDALQSIPVLGFFPTVIFWFMGGAEQRFGLEASAIFLIFTSMCWNLAFCVYEAIKAIPSELLEATRSLGLGSVARFRKIYLPASLPRIIDNSVLSWSNGWFFLMACEIIALGSLSFRLPGIGSFLSLAIDNKNWGHMGIGIICLVLLILLMDFFIWKPAQEFAQMFSFESSTQEGKTSKTSQKILNFYRNSRGFAWPRTAFEKALKLWDSVESFFEAPSERGRVDKASMKIARPLGSVVFWSLIATLLGTASFKVMSSLLSGWDLSPQFIVGAVLASGLRILIAYLSCMIVIAPLVFYFHRNAKVLRRMRSISQILGSIPATAFFPALIYFSLSTFESKEIVVLVLLATGMMWYLMFNILGGASKIPGDLLEAGDSLGLKGFLYLKRIFIPCLLPATITGSITAFGGGWNTLIVAEYFKNLGEIHQVYGVGALISRATYESGDNLLLTRSMLFMVAFILIMNHFVWQKLYNWAEARFKLEL